MKTLPLIALMMLFLGVSVSLAATRTFTGEIMDSACAKVGNHDAGYKMSNTHTPKDCTLACVKEGSKFVLYEATTKVTYQLDNQTAPRTFAGQKVKVIGTYNSSAKTIHVESIAALR